MTKIRVFDIEANSLDPDVIHCMTFGSLDKKELVSFEPHQMKEAVDYMDTCDVLIAHNCLSYDFPAIKKVLGYEYKGKRVDTLLMSRLQQPNRQPPPNARGDAKAMRSPHGLGCWGYRVGRGKPEHEDWENYSPEMLHRNREDVLINIDVYRALLEEGKGQKWKDAHMLTFKLFENLQKQEDAGWLLDIPYIKKSIHLLEHWIGRIDRILESHLPLTMDICETKKEGEYNWVRKPFMKSGKYSASVEKHYGDVPVGFVGGPFSRVCYRNIELGSSAEVKEWMLSQGWEPAEWNLDDEGNRRSPKMPKDGEFPGVESKVGKLYVKRAKSCHRRSQLEGWLSRVRGDGRIAAKVQGIADTGRMKHAGVVNVPNTEAFFGKQMRRAFICEDGFVLVGCDSAGCQNRMLAARVGDEFFTNTLIHGDKAKGTSIHQVNQKAIKEVAGFEVSYGLSKNLNYAFMFGASDNKLGRMVGGGKGEGERIRSALLSVAAGFEKLVDDLTEEWRSHAKKRMGKWGKVEYYDGWCTGLDGRPIFIKAEHTILVYMLQSDEAIMMSAAYNFLHQRLSKRFEYGKDFRVVGFMHDEFQIECKKEISEEVAKVAETCIVDAGKFYKIQCPHEGDATIGLNWYETH